MMNNPPLSRRARKDLANVFVKIYGDTRVQAAWHTKLIADQFHTKARKNPRRRSCLDYGAGNQDANGIPEMIIYCGQKKKPAFRNKERNLTWL